MLFIFHILYNFQIKITNVKTSPKSTLVPLNHLSVCCYMCGATWTLPDFILHQCPRPPKIFSCPSPSCINQNQDKPKSRSHIHTNRRNQHNWTYHAFTQNCPTPPIRWPLTTNNWKNGRQMDPIETESFTRQHCYH